MPIIAADNRKEWTPAPEGLAQAVCVDVVDMGVVETQFGPKHKVRIVFQLDILSPDDGKRHQVSKMYSLSLAERANLRKDLETWRGKKFTADELHGFDLEKLIGANAQLQIIHNISDEGRTWANIQAIIPLGKGERRIHPLDYVRVKDRSEQPKQQDPSKITDDDLPF